MKIAIVAPSAVPFTIGGAEKLFGGLLEQLNQHTEHQAELIKLPSYEANFWQVIQSYKTFSRLDLGHFDLVISTKSPTWMVKHPNHTCYMLHKLRVLYDLYNYNELTETYTCDHPQIIALQDLMRRHQGVRSTLEEFFERVEQLRHLPDIPREAFRYPGPLIREMVHFLDGIGLHPQAVKRYAAISAVVASRTHYFPGRSKVDVIYPPSSLKQFHCQPGTYLFTVSRLEGHKRIGLVIEAMGHVKSSITLKIAGTGPEAAQLQQMAANDPRIEFLGRVNDEQLIDLYAGALAVLFVPYDEDYGLVTIEAMHSGKPVITTRDAGGPTEFVFDHKTGYTVVPHPEAIAERIDYLVANPQEAERMGMAGRRTVQSITWSHTVQRLLGGSEAKTVQARRRPKLTVALTFPVYPPQGGGQSRVFHLYRQLARWFDIDLVTLTDASLPGLEAEIAPGLREIRVPKSAKHQHEEWSIEQQVGMPISDVAMPWLYSLTPDYLKALEESTRSASAIVACHPYLLPALQEVSDRPLWYEAQDVEVLLKQSLLPDNKTGRELLALTRQVEQDCCRLSRLILVCAQEDANHLKTLYGVEPNKLVEVPNGVDVHEITYVSPRRRTLLRQQSGSWAGFTALFIGSWHGPNLDAIEAILTMANQLPQVTFLLMGSGGLSLKDRHMPPNVAIMGIVDEGIKDATLSLVDVAINPMRFGSGTNLKMLDYFAAGVPVISTQFGIRGLGVEHGKHCFLTEWEYFVHAIWQFQQERPAAIHYRAEQARRLVEEKFDWAVIARQFYYGLRSSGGLG